ncbi:hypothetical protein PPYR_01741 [Photinus pyralis]|uniref:Single domain-containing protein n=1 Tax=Photinus pyralis TaxID=7054 RepID=A0A1Y1LGR4_PHOPY|nr:uncharacterized protein LOC116160007 [Photinus pyralis]KAB0804771.1 hypothetical protein PPYR_01741 [Photinus pyralis]
MQFFWLLVIFGFSSCTSGWPISESSNHSIPHEGHCFSLRPGVGSMKKGEFKTLSHVCILAMCDDDKDGTIYYNACYRKPLPPYCVSLKGESSKPYPQCCPYVNCKSLF